MKLFVYVWNDDTAVVDVERVIEATLGVEALDDLTVDSLQGGSPRAHLPTDTVICFGKRCANILRSVHPGVIELPEMKKLDNIPANRAYRLEAWETLNRLKTGAPAPVLVEQKEIELKPEEVAALFNTKLHNLRAHISEDKTDYWMGETLLGKKILISDKPLTNIPCDFRLTFEELYAAKAAVDILGLKTLTLVKGKQDD